MYPQNHILNFIRFLLPKPSWLSPRPISDSQLHMLPCFLLCPIYLVVFKGSYYLRMGYLILRGASRLDAFSVYPVPTWLLGHGFDTQPMHQRSVHPGPLVLRTAPLKYPTPTPFTGSRPLLYSQGTCRNQVQITPAVGLGHER